MRSPIIGFTTWRGAKRGGLGATGREISGDVGVLIRNGLR